MKTKEQINAYNREYYKTHKTRDAEKRQASLIRYRERNKDKIRESQRNSYQKNFVKTMLYNAKRRAEADNIPFDISIDDIFIPSHCPIYKDIELKVGRDGGKDCSPSLDKIIPELGYVKGNVQVISWKANRFKGDASLDELVTLGDWAREQRERRDDQVAF